MRFRTLIVVAVLVCAPAGAQVTTGTILGTVRDSTGAAVPAAQITITETNKGTSLQFVTDETGAYHAPFLSPGTYSVTVEKPGFKRQVRSGILLQVDQRARVDITLEVGQLTETVDVVAAAPLVRSESAELGEVIEERAIRELPLNGRLFTQLVYLAPGITPGQAGENLSGQSTFNPRGPSNFNALGSQANANAWLVDGIDNNEYTFNTVIVMPSLESVREFKVLTGVYSAEFGRGAGVVLVSTKSGSNEFHGTLFEYLRNQKLDARNYFHAKPLEKPPFRRNQFGVALSGPVYLPALYDGRNRTFIFGDYFGTRELKGLTYVNTVPTARTRLGDFSEFTDARGNLIRIYDPLTTRRNPDYDPTRPVTVANPQFLRDAFPGNVIPANRIHPVGRNVASIYPLPNAPGNFDNYTSAANRVVNDNGFNIRVDHNFSTRDTFFARYSFQNYKLDAPQGQAQCCLPTPPEAKQRFDLGPYVAGIQNTRLRTQGLALNETHIFRPNLINEFRTGFARTTPFTFQSDFGRMAAESLGIRGINVTRFATGLPNINVADFTGLSGGPAFLPVNPRETHYQISNNIFWMKNRHQIKFGYHYVRRLVSPFTNTDTRGTLNFARNFTNDPVTNTQGTGLATLLIGYSTGGSRGFLLEPYYMTVQDQAWFVQDDWKVTPRLTLNIGIRHEIHWPEKEIRNRLTNFDFTNLRLVYAGEDGISRSVGKKTHYKNFGPRFGFAWDVTGRGNTVIRGGFGLSHFPEQPSASNLLGQQVPWTVSQNFTPETNPTDWTRVPTIDNPFPPITIVKPRTTAELNAANPRVLGHSWENETPYFESWTLNIERQLHETLLWEVAYAGSRAIHLVFAYNANEVQPGPGSLASRRLLQPLANVANIIQIDPRNMSVYHGLQTKLVKRYSHGLQFLVSYTFGKNLDYGGSAASGGGAVGGPQTITNIRAGRGPSGYDVKHRGVVSYVYELPFGRNKRWLSGPGAASRILGDWQLSGITTLTTGRPFSVGLAQGVNNGAPSWPDRIGRGTLPNPDPYYWFDATAFVAPPPNTYGNVARGVLYAPGHVNFDVSVVKNFPLREALKLQFRFDAFNLFNTPAFGFPNASIGSPTVGRITSTLIGVDNRSLQFALKLDF
ncbi:MAG: carboxypeptidase regulatory-like domain-containing protein [Bryobacterales bacterium]|nr:carboxypeptidase regulatory-like domain-containing protein [Bryobacteraceae bacterium]MDW8130644.1 carboxypeptidase regulatory-like domain-containing protein [Bryobacterales bacterium]